MPRAYGYNASLLMKTESTYGTQATGNFDRMPFKTANFGSVQGLVDNELIGQGRDPLAPTRGVIRVEGDVTVPVDLRRFGQWLRMVLGAPVTTGTTPNFTHTFKTGAASLPSASVEIGLTNAPVFLMETGVMANTLAIDLTKEGYVDAVIGLIGQSETKNTATAGGTPTSVTNTQFTQFHSSIKRDGTALGNITGAQFTYDNGLEIIETVRADGKIDGCDPTLAKLTGNLEARFADATLFDAATAGTAMALEFGWTINTNQSIIFNIHEVYMPKPKVSIQGAGGISASFDFQAALNTAQSCMMTVVLKTDIATY
jgi:hypothetical protein